jgi:hypothetical protein
MAMNNNRLVKKKGTVKVHIWCCEVKSDKIQRQRQTHHHHPYLA